MTDHEISVLSSRLHRLADDMAPPVDVVGQVRAARARHQKQRRGRIALVAVATATAAAVVGTATAVDLLSTGPQRGEVADSDGRTTPSAPTTSSPSPATPSGPLTGWETRTFEGVTFSVPPGARAADSVDTDLETSPFEGPSSTWNGPRLTDESYSFVRVRITESWDGGLTPLDGGGWFTVPGAEKAYGGIDTVDSAGNPTDVTTVWLYLLDGDRQIVVEAELPAGDTGRRMAENLIASITVTPAGDPGTTQEDADPPSTTWTDRTFQGISFAVPPGTSGPDHVSEGDFIWNGRELSDGQTAFIGVSVMSPSQAGAWPPHGYEPIEVPGAPRAAVFYDVGREHGFVVQILEEDRLISIGGALADAAEVASVIASISVG